MERKILKCVQSSSKSAKKNVCSGPAQPLVVKLCSDVADLQRGKKLQPVMASERSKGHR